MDAAYTRTFTVFFGFKMGGQVIQAIDLYMGKYGNWLSL